MRRFIYLCCVVFGVLSGVLFGKASVQNVGYTIQAGSFKDLKNAGNLADSLSGKGLDAFFFKENGMYKVRFGNFKDSDSARQVALKYQKQKIIDDFYIITPQSYAINQKQEGKKTKDMARSKIAKDAHQYIGVPYKWGGTTSSGFDCSGLVRAVYRLNGLTLPRTSLEQYNTGKSIAKDKLQVGDLVFFTNNGKQVNHVGIYIGNNEFIHAPGRGKKVKKANLTTNYWVKAYRGARTYL